MTIPDPRFDEQLDREIVAGQRLRASILAGVFGVGAVLLSAMVGVDFLRERSVGLPSALPFMVAALAVHQIVLRGYLDRRMVGGERIPEWFWYLNAAVEVSAISATILMISGGLTNPVHALLTPAILGYAVFIVLSTLRLDFRTSLFTGALAAAQVALLALYLGAAGAGAAPGSEPLFDAPYVYLMKAFLLLATGLCAGFVARELRLRILRSLVAATEGERLARADQAKTAFLANMSHEIRTPLNAIIGYTQLLEKEPSRADRRHYLATIRSSGDHLLGVINQILDLSRIEAGREDLHPTEFDLEAMVLDIGRMFEHRCRQIGLHWAVEVTAAHPRLIGDERRIRQVLINLLGNAVRLTREGSVTLRVEGGTDGTTSFEVSDTGPGIPPDRIELIFEPFRQDEAGARAGGSGLGLAIANAHVRQMGGTLAVESVPGTGSAFRFSLPLQAATAAAPESAPAPAIVRLAAGCPVAAVVADDIEANRELVSIALERIGAEVRQAGGGMEAIERVRERRPDILLLDVRMPELTGPATLRRLEAEGLRAGMKVVAVSASALEHERRACLDAGFDDFLEKPLKLERLYLCLAEQLGVTFEYEARAEPAPPEDAQPAATAAIALPDRLWTDLRTAAEEFNVTELKRALEKLDALGPEAMPFADRLRTLSRRYDMEGIVAILDEVREVSRA